MNLIRLSDIGDHRDGKVISASATMDFGCRAAVTKGDLMYFLKRDVVCKLTLEGNESTFDRDVPITDHAHHAACGYGLQSSLV